MPKGKKRQAEQQIGDLENISEAEEAHIDQDLESDQVHSEGEGEDLADNFEEDYKAIPELDEYDQDEFDEEEYVDDREARLNAERVLKKNKKKGVPMVAEMLAQAVKKERDHQDHMVDIDKDDSIAESPYNFKSVSENQTQDKTPNQSNIKTEFNLEYDEVRESIQNMTGAAKNDLKAFLKEPRAIGYIQQKLASFIRTYRNSNSQNCVQMTRMEKMVANQKRSMEVDQEHLASFDQTLAIWVYEAPEIMIPIINETFQQLVQAKYTMQCECLNSNEDELFIRFCRFPIEDSLRELRMGSIGQLINVRGVVTKRTAVSPQMKKMMQICTKCGERMGPILIQGHDNIDLGECVVCNGKSFKVDSENTIQRNYQKLTVQEAPGKVEAGRVPRQKEVIVMNDLVDSAKPGDEVWVIGTYTVRFDATLNAKNSFPVFYTQILANNVKKIYEMEILDMTQEEKMKIKEMAKDPLIVKKIIKSICPSICGHEITKEAIALSIFGGQSKQVEGKHRIRGDINVLLMGDPSLGKSQFLKWTSQTFPRCIYTSGKGASAVGLTASCVRDPVTREWALEGGAMVLADQGICLVDEFDKMTDLDRTAMHEAMEQQTVSVSKAGIVATLQARCAVIAAANPVRGRYNPSLSFFENADLSEPIASRFDIMCIMRDEVDVVTDGALASFVLNSHVLAHKSDSYAKQKQKLNEALHEDEIETIPHSVLKKQVLYARRQIRPKLTGIDVEKISKVYSDLRRESMQTGGLTIGVRHVESIVRLSESYARMQLRDTVNNEDVDRAIKMMLTSFLSTQKASIQRALKFKFSRLLHLKEDREEYLFKLLTQMMRAKLNSTAERKIKLSMKLFQKEAESTGFKDISSFLNGRIFNGQFVIKDDYILSK